jgi:uncharacterized protein YecE (DUF72 family)
MSNNTSTARDTEEPIELDLFGEPIPVSSAQPAKSTKKANAAGEVSEVNAATASENNIALANTLASALASRVHMGTSSWSFPGWQGLVYDGAHTEGKLARDGLHAYAAHPLFRAVSLDRTFYAPISETEYRQYASQVPAHFRFVVKAPMAITSSYLRDDKTGAFSDSPYFLDVDYAINEFVAPCSAGLQSNCGPLVFQFPPQGKRATSNPDPWINALYRFLTKLPPGLGYAIEVRDRELLTDRFFKCLDASKTTFCVASHARMPAPHEQIALLNQWLPDADFVCRWSLHSGFKYEDAKSRYAPFNRIVDEDIDSRNAIAGAAFQAARHQRQSFITINNKAEGSAPLSVEKLAEAIAALANNVARNEAD